MNKDYAHFMQDVLISRQDAIAEFRDGRDVYDIMESIEELPSAQPDGDFISRQAAIEAVWKLDKDANEYVVDDTKEIHGYCTAIGVCVGELSALPSAPDSRQRGEWVGCTGCEHYDQQQTRLICHDCRRYYSDKYKGGEDDADE